MSILVNGQDHRAWLSRCLKMHTGASHLPVQVLKLTQNEEHMQQWTSDELLALTEHLISLWNGSPNMSSSSSMPSAKVGAVAAYLRPLKICSHEILLDLFSGTGRVGASSSQLNVPSLSLDILGGWDLTDKSIKNELVLRIQQGHVWLDSI